MANTNQLDKAPPPSGPDDKSHANDAPAAPIGQSTAQSEAQALMKASLQPKPNDTGNRSYLEITPLKELAPPGQAVATDMQQAHEQLIASATKNFSGDAEKLKKFEDNMSTFEARMKGASPDEVAKTYTEVKRLLDSPSSIVSDKQRCEIASDIVDRAAHPLASNQGYSNDCAAASIENLLYAKSPALAAGYVTDVALTGKFTDQQGNVVSVDKDSVAIHDNHVSDKLTKSGSEIRSFGDQLMQLAVRNEELALINKKNGISSDGNLGLKYSIEGSDDFQTGEKITDYSKKPPLDVTSTYEGGMSLNNIPDVAVALDPKNAKDADSLLLDANSFDNAEQLKAALSKPNSPYPRMLGVNVGEEPFASSMGETGNGEHAITVESYDPKTNLIHYRNSKFGSRDMTTDADTMYNAMLTDVGDGQITDGANTVKANRKEFVTQSKDAKAWIYNIMQQIEVKERAGFLQGLSKESGIDMSTLLTDQQKQDLRITQ